jgi:streptogramin lyase
MREARLVSPGAVLARERSQTEFAHFDASQAARLARSSFPGVMGRTVGGVPALPTGQRIVRFLGSHAARVSLPGGGRGVVESFEPIAMPVGRGRFRPIDLGLHAAGDGYAPVASGVGVRIPRRLSEGVGLPGAGVSLTPVDGDGHALGGSVGMLEGASVFYANTQREMDTVAKPTADGFQVDGLLRGVESPQALFYRVGMPRGARLTQDAGSGVVRVVRGGHTLATVVQPSAEDAAETPVPVSMSVAGDVLVVRVGDHSGSFQYPIMVDPEVYPEYTHEKQIVEEGKKDLSNWEFKSTSESKFGHEPNGGPNKDEGPGKGYLETSGVAEYAETEKAYWGYETRGDSKIYELVATTEGKNKGAEIESFLELEGAGASEDKDPLSTEFTKTEYGSETSLPLCAKNGTKVECVPAAGAAGNVVRFQQSVQKKPSNYKFTDKLTAATVYLAEPVGTHSTAGYNTTSGELEGEVETKPGEFEMVKKRANVIATGGWLTKREGAVELIGKDPGVGVSASELEYESSPGKWEVIAKHNYIEEELCKGVQCSAEQKELWVLAPQLASGEDKIRYRAEDAMAGTESPESEDVHTVKVDASKPRRLLIRGLPLGSELSERTYELTVEATDGEGSTVPSPGIGSISLSVDGTTLEKVSKTEASDECSVSKGACTATAKYKIKGQELGAGHHALVIVAADRAGNETRQEETFSIRHSTPVALGPGSLDLQSGDFSLAAQDVSMGAGLTFSRSYSSRALEQGDEGPLGPQWSFSVGAVESLVEMTDHSMLLTAGNGKQTIFAQTKTSTYESPVGDSNLKLTVKENEAKTEKQSFVLEDAADHSATTFKLPEAGASAWVPSVSEGDVGKADTVTFAYKTVEQHFEYPLPSSSTPEGIAAGPGGGLWVADYGTSKIDKVGVWGGIAGEYALASGSDPEGVTEGPEGDVWFTGRGTGKIGRLTPAGELKEYSALPSGSDPSSIMPGPEKEAALWFTDDGTSEIGKINASTGEVKEYAVGSDPYAITAAAGEGYMWFTMPATGKIGRLTTATGEVKEYGPLPTKSEPHGIATGAEGDLWFADYGTGKIGKITPAGAISEYGGLPSGSDPDGIATGAEGDLWFADYGTGKIGKITPAGIGLKEFALPSGSDPDGIVTGPDGKLWFTDRATNDIGTITPAGKITEPTEARAPQPKSVECKWTSKPTEMATGCRALEFAYDTTATTATGEGESEWGNYLGRLEKISLVAYNPASGVEKMQETAVAEYSYDKQGRLRAEWDPRITPNLKTTYGYDQEGHVTALTPPGQETWALTYGAITGDEGTGRLLKATQARASTALWKGEAIQNTEAPKVSGTPVIGVRNDMTVSNGTWTGSPVVYSYQWEDCNSAVPKWCTPIPGATNQSYTPTNSDARHTLAAEVIATNGDGSSKVVSSNASVEATWAENKYSLGGLLTEPKSVTIGPDGNLWVAELKIVSKVTKTGSVTEYALPSSCAGPPKDIAAGPAGENALWLTCATGAGEENNIAKVTTAGVFTVYKVGKGNFALTDITAGPDGNLWFTMQGTHGMTWGKIGKITSAGVITEYSLSNECEPLGIIPGPEKENTLWFAESSRSGKKGAIGQISTSGTEYKYYEVVSSDPENIAIGPNGDSIWYTEGGRQIGEFSLLRHEDLGPLSSNYPGVDPEGSMLTDGPNKEQAIWFVDNLGGDAEHITKISTRGPSGKGGELADWSEYAGIAGEYTLQFDAGVGGVVVGPESENSLWFTQAEGIEKEKAVAELSKFEITPPSGSEPAAPSPGITIDYNVPLEGSNAPAQMGVNPTTNKPEPEQWGQKEEEDPVEATSIFPMNSPQGWPASSYASATTYYLDADGREVNVASPSTGKYGAVSTTEYNEENDVTRKLTADNRAAALEAGEKSADVAKLLSTYNTYRGMCSKESETNHERESLEFGTRLCETEGPQHEVKYVSSKGVTEELARNHVKYFYDENVPSGEPYAKETFNLVTETRSYTELSAEGPGNGEEVEGHITQTSYSGQSYLGWRLRAPTSVTTEPHGADVTRSTLYNEETGQVTETRGPRGQSGGSPQDSKIIYYTSENEAEVSGCRKHAEWAGLVCMTEPAKQPETSKIPNLPTVESTYDMWDQPETVTEIVTSPPAEPTKRIKKNTYDGAGRLKTSATTVTGPNTDKTVPAVEYEYESKTGLLVKQSTIGGKILSISSKYNTLGQMTEYVDGSGADTTLYTYGGPEVGDQITEVSDSSNGGKEEKEKSRQTYTYNKTTMQMETLWDSAAETFTASYDTEGKLASVIYPNGMCAIYTHNSIGEATHLEYIKTTNCSEKSAPVWFSESAGANVSGEDLARTSTLATEKYTYDALGRLTEVQETPVGGQCSVRVYEYEEANRTKLISRKPGSKGECATSGGTEEKHTYDEADRMTDTGIEYESLGDITKLPAADAEGNALTSTFYTDGAVNTQTQNSVTNEYKLDPAGRVLRTTSGGKTTINHYDAAGEAVSWGCEESGSSEACAAGKWTRYIPGIEGTLAAVQTNDGTPVLQLHDLEGDVVATAALSKAETKLLSTYNSTEFGVPNEKAAPPTFAWLGAKDIPKSLSSGVITYGATSYVPQTGRPLQAARVETPGYPIAVGGGQAYIGQEEPWVWQGAGREAAEAPGIGAAEQYAAELAACEANPEACPVVEGADPHVVAFLSRWQTEAATGSIDGGHLVSYVDIFQDLKKWFKVDFLAQVEEWAIKTLVGINKTEIENWAYNLAGNLTLCEIDMIEKWLKPKNPHCWVYFKTKEYHVLFKFLSYELPAFGESPQVAYCPVDESNCEKVNEQELLFG